MGVIWIAVFVGFVGFVAGAWFAWHRLHFHGLAPRPPFYDPNPAHPDVATGAAGATRLSELDFVVFDTETTGLKPSGGDEIVQIGAVRIQGGRLCRHDTFDTLVNPGRPIPPASTKFHGIVDDMVSEAPGVTETVGRFRAFLGSQVLVAQNAAFDMKFLTLKEEAAGVVFDCPVLDTMLLSIFLNGERGDHSLDGLTERYGIAAEDRHTALGDALATAEILLHMIPLLTAKGIETLDQALAETKGIGHRHRHWLRY